jgi:uncharacterized protein
MSTMIATFDLPTDSPRPALSDPACNARAEPRPWGFWGSLGWALLAVATAVFAGVVHLAFWMLTHQPSSPDPSDPIFEIGATILTLVVPVIVLVIAVKIRRYPLCGYFALGRISRGNLVLGIGCLVALTAFEVTAGLLGIDFGTASSDADYQAAKLAGMLPMLWLATVIVAPVTEELVFRGFLHRSWASSWLGVCGTIILTSALWALLHQQYNWIGIFDIFLTGLVFGWLRQRSGSTTLTIMLHALGNLFVMILAAI